MSIDRCGFRPASGATSYSRNNIAARSNPSAARKLVEYWKCQLCPTVKSDGRPICMNGPGDELPKVGAVDHFASPPNAAFITHQTEHQAMGTVSHPCFRLRCEVGVHLRFFLHVFVGPRRSYPSSLPSLKSLEFPTAISWCGGIV